MNLRTEHQNTWSKKMTELKGKIDNSYFTFNNG